MRLDIVSLYITSVFRGTLGVFSPVLCRESVGCRNHGDGADRRMRINLVNWLDLVVWIGV